MNESRSRSGGIANGVFLALAVVAAGTTGSGCGGGGDAGTVDETPDSTATGGNQPKSTGAASGAGNGGTSGAAGTTVPGASATAPAATAPAATAPTATAPTATAPATPSTMSAPAPAARTGSIVPLYSLPSDPAWAALIAAKKAHASVPVIAVINPNNGPGTAARSDYMNGVGQLTGAGVKVAGYVATGYGKRSVSEVKADIDRWRDLYPDAKSIFFDEMANNPGLESHYSSLTSYAKGRGIEYTIGNPGVDSKPSYVGTVDTILIVESAGLPSADKLAGWHAEHPREAFGIIPHSVSSLDAGFVAMAKSRVGYIFVQNDTMPNPWDTLPPYFDALLAALA
jgi:hypothetical protein